MDNIVSVKLDSRYASTLGVWQYDYGQVLRITGPELPPAVEVQFSLDEKSGETLSRVGTTVDGVTEVKIPDELLTHSATSNYRIYAYIYLTDETSGNTKYEITIPVRVRSKPTSPTEDPETDSDLFRETVVAVNASAERAENAASSATESAASADETLAEIKRVTDGISEDIENANTAKSELSGMINSAEEKKKELESSIGKAGEAKTELDSSISSTGEKKLALDATVEQANTVDASLKEQIGSAEKIQANVEQIAKNKADISSLNEDLEEVKDKKITKFYASNQGETHLADSDNGKIQDMMIYGKSSQDGAPTPENPVEIKSVVNPTMKVRGKNLVDIYGYSASDMPSPEAERVLFNTYGTTISTTEKTDKLVVNQEIIDGATANSYTSGYFCVGINHKLEDGKYYIISFKINVIQNPFHVSDIGVLLNGVDAYMAQVVGDKVTVKAKYNGFNERQYVEFRTKGMSLEFSNFMITEVGETDDYEPYTEQSVQLPYTLNAIPVASGGNVTINGQQYIADYVNVERGKLVKMVDSSKLDNTQSIVNKTEWLLAAPQEIDLTQEEVQTLKTLATYYPTTNIFINSDRLDGYTVFNYPISMANGWNYVKQQLNDNRDYIYDMDMQSAEAYVNSEYAVALTELEV